jgi:hypothetical protein
MARAISDPPPPRGDGRPQRGGRQSSFLDSSRCNCTCCWDGLCVHLLPTTCVPMPTPFCLLCCAQAHQAPAWLCTRHVPTHWLPPLQLQQRLISSSSSVLTLARRLQMIAPRLLALQARGAAAHVALDSVLYCVHVCMRACACQRSCVPHVPSLHTMQAAQQWASASRPQKRQRSSSSSSWHRPGGRKQQRQPCCSSSKMALCC